MASAPTSTPPKFVPTLTEEVELPADASPDQAALADPVEVPGGYELPAGGADDDEDSAPQPPLDTDAIPELDAVVEVVDLVEAEVPHQDLASIPEISDVVTDAEIVSTVAAEVDAPAELTDAVEPETEPESEPVAAAQPASLPDGYEEYVVHRVMQRVDVILEQRLREAIALVIQEQTRSIVPRLREEVESVVRQSVYEAVADELASTSK